MKYNSCLTFYPYLYNTQICARNGGIIYIRNKRQALFSDPLLICCITQVLTWLLLPICIISTFLPTQISELYLLAGFVKQFFFIGIYLDQPFCQFNRQYLNRHFWEKCQLKGKWKSICHQNLFHTSSWRMMPPCYNQGIIKRLVLWPPEPYQQMHSGLLFILQMGKNSCVLMIWLSWLLITYSEKTYTHSS